MTTVQDAICYRWDDLARDFPIEGLERRRIDGDRFMVCQITLHEGCRVETHRHDNEQMAMVMAGRLKFGLGEGPDYREEIVGPGEVVRLPSNVAHSVVALAESQVLDIFSPVSDRIGVDEQRDREGDRA